MDFIFFCPSVHQTFDSPDFKITKNQGIKTDSYGNRYLDAIVVLTKPCPLCGETHEYQASELTCPFQ